MNVSETWEDFEKLLADRGITYRDIGTKHHQAFALHKRLTGPIQSRFSIKLPTHLIKRKRKSGNKETGDEENYVEDSLKQVHETDSEKIQPDIVLSQTTDVVLSSTRIDHTPKSVNHADSVKRPRLSPIANVTEKRQPTSDATITEPPNDLNNNNGQESTINVDPSEDRTQDSESLILSVSEEIPSATTCLNQQSNLLRETVSKARVFLEKHHKTLQKSTDEKRKRSEVTKINPKISQSSSSKSNSYSLLCQIANHLAQWRHNLEVESNR